MEWLRDLVIVIWGIIFTLVAITATMMVFFLYKRVRVVLDKIETIVKKGETFSSQTQRVLVGPLIQVAAITQGIKQLVSGIIKIFSGKRR